MDLESMLLFQLYIAALVAQRQRQWQKLRRTHEWQQNVLALQAYLANRGLVL